MLDLDVIDNGLACDCGVGRDFDYDISRISQEISFLKMNCTNNNTKYIIFGI